MSGLRDDDALIEAGHTDVGMAEAHTGDDVLDGFNFLWGFSKPQCHLQKQTEPELMVQNSSMRRKKTSQLCFGFVFFALIIMETRKQGRDGKKKDVCSAARIGD